MFFLNSSFYSETSRENSLTNTFWKTFFVGIQEIKQNWYLTVFL